MTIALGQWHFPVDGAWTIAGLALLTAATTWAIVSAWKRLGERSVGRWAVVTILNLLAASALFAWLSPPLRPASTDGVAILLTEGTVDAELTEGPLVFALPGPDTAPGVTRLTLPGQLPLRHPGIGSLQVMGHGLHDDQWSRLPDNFEVRFQPAPLEGLVEPSWPRRLPLGRPMDISARYIAPTPDAVATVSLVDPAGVVVTDTSVRSGATFRLTARPRAKGLVNYQLRLTRGTDTLETVTVPVEITGGAAVDIGIVQSAPSFETRQLQHWAGQHGSRVTIHTQISRDRTLEQGVNTEPGLAANLSPAWLDKLDLLIVDGRRWSSLDAMDIQGIESAVRDGLGLMILADESFEPGPWLDRYTLVRGETPDESAIPALAGYDNDIALPVLGGRLVTTGATALTTSENGLILEAWHGHGLGRVAVSVLRERHRWQTAGRGDVYAGYWANVLQTLARPGDQADLAAPAPDRIARARLKHRLCVNFNAESSTTETPGAGLLRLAALGGESSSNPIAFNRTTGPVGCAETWPLDDGWHRVEWHPADATQATATGYEYVFSDQDWLMADRHQRQVATMVRATRVPATRRQPGETPRTPLAPGGPWWLFVICAGLLWIERKHDAMR